MNLIKSIVFILLILSMSFSSCRKLTDVKPIYATDSTLIKNAAVNNWIYDQLKTYYLWEEQMKIKSNTNLTLAPELYFDSLLVQPGVLDRFSWMQNATDLSNTLNGINTVMGVKYALFNKDATKTNIVLSISMVLKNSPAEQAGIKRGDLISQVDGTDLTQANYSSLLSNQSLKLTMATFSNGVISNSNKIISVTKAQVQTDPIQIDTVLTFGTKVVGYLTYTQFLSSYDQAVRNVFAKFKSRGVNELVLDLRFNGGGSINSSDILSSLIVKGLNSNKLMNYQEWNPAIMAHYQSLYGNNYFKQNWLNEPNNLGTLKRVYILTSPGTASASELVINNLKPFMDVYLVGDHTYGKNVGSISITDDQNRWDWGMQPIVLKTYNSLGQSDYGTKTGFTPDFPVTDNVIPFKPLGDPTETLLKEALLQMGVTSTALKASNLKMATVQVNLLKNMAESDNPYFDRKEMYLDKFPMKK